MRILLFASFLLTFCTGCIDETFPGLDELPMNLFAADGPPLFTLTNATFTPTGGVSRRVRIEFDNVLDEVPETQLLSLASIMVTIPEREVSISLDREFFLDPTERRIGDQICYGLAFVGSASELGNTRQTDLCVIIE